MSAQANSETRADAKNLYGKVTATGTLYFERLLPGPAERLWAYLTERDKCAQWLAAVVIEPKIGGKVELRFKHDKLTAHEEATPEQYEDCPAVHGKITHYEPYKKLGYTWTWQEEGPEVLFELVPQGSKVLLKLTHRNVSSRDMMISFASGWHTHLGILADRLDGRNPEPFWDSHEKFESDYQTLIKGE